MPKRSKLSRKTPLKARGGNPSKKRKPRATGSRSALWTKPDGTKIHSKKVLYEYAKGLWSIIVRTRAKHRCEWCGDKATEAHHQIAKGKCPGLALELRNGVALCSKCHWEFHQCNPGKGVGIYAKLRASDHKYCQDVYGKLRTGEIIHKQTVSWLTDNIKELEVTK